MPDPAGRGAGRGIRGRGGSSRSASPTSASQHDALPPGQVLSIALPVGRGPGDGVGSCRESRAQPGVKEQLDLVDCAVLPHIAEHLVVLVLKPGHWIFRKRFARNTVANKLTESHAHPIATRQQSRSYGGRGSGAHREGGLPDRDRRRPLPSNRGYRPPSSADAGPMIVHQLNRLPGMRGYRSRPNTSTWGERCCTSTPPSTTRQCPVTYSASAEARNTAGPARSSGVPPRPHGTVSSRRFLAAGSTCSGRGAISPGTSAFTRIP